MVWYGVRILVILLMACSALSLAFNDPNKHDGSCETVPLIWSYVIKTMRHYWLFKRNFMETG